MSGAGAPPFWTRPGLRRAAGDALRPGGLALTRRGLDLAGVAPGARVLDAGCGPGATLEFLAGLGLRSCGLDPAPERPGPGAPPRVAGDAQALPFASGCFAAVFCECVLSLLPDPGRAVREFARVLAPGGSLVLADLFRPERTPRSPADGSCAAGALSFSEALGMFQACGLHPRAVENHTRQLKELAARLIFLGEPAGSGAPPGNACCATGYFLLVAGKPGGAPCSTTPASG